LGAEVALAFACGLAFFALLSVLLVAADSRLLPVIALGLAGIGAVIAILRILGIAYAVAAVPAGLLAFDWFYVPPIHAHVFPDAESLADLLLFLAAGALIGVLTARAARRADTSELARSELASEQAALRRVATLVAEGVPASEFFAAVAEEAGRLLGVDGAWIEFYEGEDVVKAGEWSRPGMDPPTFDRAKVEDAPVAAAVRRSGGVVRVDDFESVQPTTRFAGQPKMMSLVGAPITVERDQWGVMLAWSHDRPLPGDAESHLTQFTDLVATAIANSDARAKVSRLADQQAAMRRVATLVAEGVAAPRLFEAVAEEAGRLLEVDGARIATYDGEDVVSSAEWSKSGHDPPTFDRVRVEEAPVAGEVRRTGRVVRFDDFERIQGGTVFADQPRVTSLVGAPIIVEGDQWGVMIAWSRDSALPPDAEAHLTAFTELIATAIANAEARREVATLADEQAALRRVATLVAEGVPPPEVFAAVARELGQLLGVDSTHLARYEPDGMVTGVGSWSPHGTNAPVGTRVPLDKTTVTGLVHESGRPARLDGYEHTTGEIAELVKSMGIRSSVGAPITVDGRPWGVMIAASNRREPLTGDTEARIAAFSDLVATAISNTEARTETHRLAEDQAALRRVATLVARGVPPGELFDAVAAEVGSLLDTDLATLFRYEGEDVVKMLSIWTSDGASLEAPETWGVEELGLSRSTAQEKWPGRVDDWTQFSGPLAHFVRDDAGVTSSVSSPILVEGRLWGALAVHATHEEPLPADTEVRVSEFTGLVATAISNVQAREDLAASRARIVVATDEERRRVVRDLHDGAQQRLVHTVVTLTMASQALEHTSEKEVSPLVTEALQHAQEATDELRELAHGILPSVLTRGGLQAGVGALASRTPVPVEADISVGRLPPAIEATAYFIVAEALTNVAKHARANQALVTAQIGNGTLHIQVRDDGVGGADAAGTGLVGLADRASALDGNIRLESPASGGTLLTAHIPVPHREYEEESTGG
jgi:signal transduction histidine kinase/pilus assembly protein TadC